MLKKKHMKKKHMKKKSEKNDEKTHEEQQRTGNQGVTGPKYRGHNSTIRTSQLY
jgi:hypothetical protein